MSIADGFYRGFTTAKLNQNNRDLQAYADELVKATLSNREKDKEIADLKDEYKSYKFSFHKMKTHNAAESARNAYLMTLLDEVHGKENNPARQVAFPDMDCRIPSGDRKGDVVTKADEVYLGKFRDFYTEEYESMWKKHVKKWMDFFHPRITY
jgi:hypothetical protein